MRYSPDSESLERQRMPLSPYFGRLERESQLLSPEGIGHEKPFVRLQGCNGCIPSLSRGSIRGKCLIPRLQCAAKGRECLWVSSPRGAKARECRFPRRERDRNKLRRTRRTGNVSFPPSHKARKGGNAGSQGENETSNILSEACKGVKEGTARGNTSRQLFNVPGSLRPHHQTHCTHSSRGNCVQARRAIGI